MLKQRIAGALLVKNGIVVQSIGFNRYLPVGSPRIAVEYLNKWGIDEISILDIDATPQNRAVDHKKIREYSKECHVPIAVGGGIKAVSDIENIITNGADKVIINSAFHGKPELISKGAEEFGSQSIIVSIDVKKQGDDWLAFSNSGETPVNRPVFELAKMAEEYGAGEILINSIDRDGSGSGYDMDLLTAMKTKMRIPVIALGGAGGPEHLLEALRIGISCAAAANMFHFTEHSVIMNKVHILKYLKSVRNDTYLQYLSEQIGDDGRALKQSDEALAGLRFEIFEEEVI